MLNAFFLPKNTDFLKKRLRLLAPTDLKIASGSGAALKLPAQCAAPALQH